MHDRYNVRRGFGLLFATAIFSFFIFVGCGADKSSANGAGQTALPAAQQLEWKVVASYPHDPGAFLQGLVWEGGKLFESTGQEGQSTLREVELDSGKVLRKINLSDTVFGEGLAVISNRFYQLTWRSKTGYVYEKENFRFVKEFYYDTEGWGLASDGKQLVMSDGSDRLYWLDPETLKQVKQVSVTLNGRPLRALNELEFIDGAIWANVWRTDNIVIIDPASGHVTHFLDLKGLLPAADRTGREDVLNGIAYDSEKKRIFVGGKYWSKLFEIQIVKPQTAK